MTQSSKAVDHKAIAAERKKRAANLRADVGLTFSTPHGQRTLKLIMDMCGYQKPSVVADPASHEVMVNSTIYNEARRNLYLTLRNYTPQQTLIAVENNVPDSDDALFS